MASPDEEADRIAAAATVDEDLTYDPLVDGELEPELNSDFLANPDVPTSSKQVKRGKKVAEETKENEQYGRTKNNLKTTLLFSGLVVAVVGAIFAVLKKIKEA